MRLFAAALAGMAMQAGMSAAQELPGDPAAGLEYARAICADCHDVEREWDDLAAFYGPAFVDIAAMPSTTVMSLRVFLRTPHENMPNLILSEQDRDNVISYILSLKPEAE
jgi:mono/diheme cytochrome c family protein